MDARDTPSKGVCFLFGVSLHQGACRRGRHKGALPPHPPETARNSRRWVGFCVFVLHLFSSLFFDKKAHYFCQKCCNIRPFCYNG